MVDPLSNEPSPGQVAPAMSNVLRGLLIIVLGLGLAGFGVCSLCGGVTALVSLGEKSSAAGGMLGMGLMFFVGAGFFAWLFWLGLRALLRKRPTEPAPIDPAPPSP